MTLFCSCSQYVHVDWPYSALISIFTNMLGPEFMHPALQFAPCSLRKRSSNKNEHNRLDRECAVVQSLQWEYVWRKTVGTSEKFEIQAPVKNNKTLPEFQWFSVTGKNSWKSGKLYTNLTKHLKKGTNSYLCLLFRFHVEPNPNICTWQSPYLLYQAKKLNFVRSCLYRITNMKISVCHLILKIKIIQIFKIIVNWVICNQFFPWNLIQIFDKKFHTGLL